MARLGTAAARRLVSARTSIGAALLCVLAAACGLEPLPPVSERIAQWQAQGEAAWVGRDWDRVAMAHRRLFALLDPAGTPAPVRASVAFRVARAHTERARVEPLVFRATTLRRHARIWLREALACHPTMVHVWFERAQLLELEHAPPAELARAYAAFLDGINEVSPEADAMGKETAHRVRLAQTRLHELETGAK